MFFDAGRIYTVCARHIRGTERRVSTQASWVDRFTYSRIHIMLGQQEILMHSVRKGIIEAFSQGFTKQINLAAFLAVWKGIHIASSYSLLWHSESSNGPLWKVAFIFQLQEHV